MAIRQVAITPSGDMSLDPTGTAKSKTVPDNNNTRMEER
jgi:hypothetical protein